MPENKYIADVISTTDYYAFGSALPGRSFNTPGYDYGHGGQLADDEITGSRSHYSAEYWEYDSRLGRRWNVDPITYPWQSSYATFNNNPIVFNDPSGLKGDWKLGDNIYLFGHRKYIPTEGLKRFVDSAGDVLKAGASAIGHAVSWATEKVEEVVPAVEEVAKTIELKEFEVVLSDLSDDAFGVTLGAANAYTSNQVLGVGRKNPDADVGTSELGGYVDYVEKIQLVEYSEPKSVDDDLSVSSGAMVMLRGGNPVSTFIGGSIIVYSLGVMIADEISGNANYPGPWYIDKGSKLDNRQDNFQGGGGNDDWLQWLIGGGFAGGTAYYEYKHSQKNGQTKPLLKPSNPEETKKQPSMGPIYK